MLSDNEVVRIKESITIAKQSGRNPSESIDVVLSMILNKLSGDAKPSACNPNARYQDDFFCQIRENISDCIRAELEAFLRETGGSAKPLRCSSLFGRRNEEHFELLFDHHFWNDCDPYWKDPHCGVYGATPGEDVIIKVFGYCCSKVM